MYKRQPQEQVEIIDVAEEVAQALSLKAKNREMKIRISSDEDLPQVTADRAQVKQVIQNLADNALKYGLSGTEVTLGIKKCAQIPPSASFKTAPGEAVAISVNNKGPKISPENLARLTERFYRMQEHKDLNIKGTGLGLAIAKHIIIRHSGNLTVNSNGYNGTTFTLYLPVKQEN